MCLSLLWLINNNAAVLFRLPSPKPPCFATCVFTFQGCRCGCSLSLAPPLFFLLFWRWFNYRRKNQQLSQRKTEARRFEKLSGGHMSLEHTHVQPTCCCGCCCGCCVSLSGARFMLSFIKSVVVVVRNSQYRYIHMYVYARVPVTFALPTWPLAETTGAVVIARGISPWKRDF